MKLRFRANSLRLRVNQMEVQKLAAGDALKEMVEFPGNSALSYILQAVPASDPQALFSDGSIQVSAPQARLASWATSEDIGLYFTLPTATEPLKIAIEKDLECIDGPLDEKDPNAFPRTSSC